MIKFSEMLNCSYKEIFIEDYSFLMGLLLTISFEDMKVRVKRAQDRLLNEHKRK